MLKTRLVLIALAFCAHSLAAKPVALPVAWASDPGLGMNVDWARTERGIREFDPLAVRDFQQRGIGHVRIRVAGAASHQRLVHLRRIVEACQQYNIVPIISYEADTLKAKPTPENAAQVVTWWVTVAHFFANNNAPLMFDLVEKPAGKLINNPQLLNSLYDKTVRAIHKISPRRYVFIAPDMYASPESLTMLKVPEPHRGLVMAEWQMFPDGPAKSQWTTGTAAEKAAIHARIAAALRWQQKTGRLSWVSAWSPGNKLPLDSQVAFATFVACELQKARLPYAVNNNETFYDGEEGAWRPEMQPVLDALLQPRCQ